jgi:hypothetical protein
MQISRNVLILAGALAVPAIAQAAVTWPGPDSYGYSGSTSTGNTFSTIKGNGGALVTPADPAAATYDDRFYTAPVGFAFPFYGVTNNAVFVTTNGLITFGGTTNTDQSLNTQINASYTNASFNSATAIPSGSNVQVDRAMIAPWWDDLQFTSGQTGGIYTLNRTVSGVQEFVIEWANVAFFNSTTDGVSFQAILRDNGTITFNYGDTSSSNSTNTLGASATIGIHNLGGTNVNNQYLQYNANTAGALPLGGFRVDIVPGPGAAALLGLGGLMAARRRRS